jgi:hypothetical protein
VHFALSSAIDDGRIDDGLIIDGTVVDCKGYIDDVNGKCIGKDEISTMEAINMKNIGKMISSFSYIKTNTIPNFNYLSKDIKNELLNKVNGYNEKNSGIVTTTIEKVPRDKRDLFFKDRYAPHISLMSGINILGDYNYLGESIQNVVVLLNSTQAYIQRSQIDTGRFVSGMQSAKTQLESYIDLIDSDISVLYGIIRQFDNNHPDTFDSFIESSVINKQTFDSRKVAYFEIKDSIVALAVEAIRAVEAASNGNSSIVASPNIIYSDGSSSSKITITVKNTLNNPIVDKRITLTTKNDGVVITPSATNSDIAGRADFTITSTVEGYISLTAIIENESLELLGSNIINVKSLVYKGCVETGGNWIDEKCVCPDDYNWDEEKLECVIFEELIPQKLCEQSGGTWDEKCVCPDDYNWDEEKLECVKK